MRGEPVEFEGCIVTKETPLALRVLVGDENVWIPKSQILEGSELAEDEDRGTLIIPRWLAEEKGLV
jgi:hypothetical protein